MAEILVFLPTYSPDAGEEDGCGRPLIRLTLPQIAERINTLGQKSRARPYVYMDAIDSILGSRPDVELVVADAMSSDIIRTDMAMHHKQSGGYELAFYPEKLSQWIVFNDIIQHHCKEDTKYVVYSSSDIIWPEDWVEKAIVEFEKDPALQILFPCVNSGDMSIPIQLAQGPRDMDLIDPADYISCIGMAAARAPCLNAYAMIFRIDFFKTYGGYPDLTRNCFSESWLYYMCQAMGGKMRLVPRCWVYHHNGIDVWVGEGGFYHYSAEKPIFDKTMDALQSARSEGRVTVDYLRKLLYKNGKEAV